MECVKSYLILLFAVMLCKFLLYFSYSPEATIHLMRMIKKLLKKDGICFMANGKFRFLKCQKVFELSIIAEQLNIKETKELPNDVVLHIIN